MSFSSSFSLKNLFRFRSNCNDSHFKSIRFDDGTTAIRIDSRPFDIVNLTHCQASSSTQHSTVQYVGNENNSRDYCQMCDRVRLGRFSTVCIQYVI